MWQLRLLDKAAYQAAVSALDAFAQGDARLLAPLVARCHAQLRSEEFARRCPGAADSYAGYLDRGMAGGDLTDLSHYVIALTAMPDYQLTLVGGDDESPNLAGLGDHDAWLYSELCDVAPGFNRWWTRRCQDDTERYAYGLSMFLLGRDNLVRLREALHKVVEGPSSRPGLGKVRDRLLDLIARSLADERTTIAVSDIG